MTVTPSVQTRIKCMTLAASFLKHKQSYHRLTRKYRIKRRVIRHNQMLAQKLIAWTRELSWSLQTFELTDSTSPLS